MEELFYRYNPWWEGKYQLADVVERPGFLDVLKKHLSSKQVVFLTGLRRVGKTTSLKLLIKDLIDNKSIDPKHIFYISLDDYSISKKTISEIVDEYRKIHKITFKEKVYLFLDEVAYQEDFEIQLKNLYDNQNTKIYASSSSASIIKSKKPYLTGRNVIVELLPLDFEEYLEFKNIEISKADQKLKDKYFEEYLEKGGLPEYVLQGDVEYLKELVDDIIYKDIAAFYNVKDPQNLKDFFMLLMERSGKIASINKMAHILDISPDTAKRYLQMFADAYLIYLVPRFGKTNDGILSPKKVYAPDLGIRTFFTGFRDIGSLFENYVYLKIKDRNPCYVYEDKLEIDFLTEDKTLIEVKYNREMKEKQLEFFNKIKAKKKIKIYGINDLKKIE
ncbi:ATP-binding protein [bacterium]|nr:MAG: ATP-binding protein [bacterium]